MALLLQMVSTARTYILHREDLACARATPEFAEDSVPAQLLSPEKGEGNCRGMAASIQETNGVSHQEAALFGRVPSSPEEHVVTDCRGQGRCAQYMSRHSDEVFY